MTGAASAPGNRLPVRDLLAGMSVALVLIPQAMAYANLAGLSSQHGLYAAAVAPIAAAFFASSPYLQTGPTALTALLTLGALVPLAAVGSTEYAGLAAVLALVVGVVRVFVGLTGTGWISYIMSRPMLDGFTSGAAVLIVSSQLPGAVGVSSPVDGVLQGAWWTLTSLGTWEGASLALSLMTVAVVLGGRRVHPLLPGVLIAAMIGLGFSIVTGYQGRTIGPLASGLPAVALDLPWEALPALLVAGAVIAFVGFAEAAAIARVYAAEDRMSWDANREFLSQGAANLVAGMVSGLPVGGSFGRSALNRLAGARTRWSGLVTGLTMMAFLPFASILNALPAAILSAIVIAAVAGLIRMNAMLRVWRMSRAQGMVSWLTFGLTLALAPHIERAVLLGILASVAVHLWQEMTPGVRSWSEPGTLHLEPKGVLWFGSAQIVERALIDGLESAGGVGRAVVHLGGLGRIDLSGALALQELLQRAEDLGVEVELVEAPGHAHRILTKVFGAGGAFRSDDAEPD